MKGMRGASGYNRDVVPLVRREEQKRSARFQNSVYLPQEPTCIWYVLQYIAGEYQIKCPIFERKLCAIKYDTSMDQRILANTGVEVGTYNLPPPGPSWP